MRSGEHMRIIALAKFGQSDSNKDASASMIELYHRKNPSDTEECALAIMSGMSRSAWISLASLNIKALAISNMCSVALVLTLSSPLKL